MLPFLALLGVTLAWFLLPLLPALWELARPSDIAPLKVVDRSSGHVAYFARNFRQYLERALPAEAGAGDYSGHMLDGTEFIRVNLRPAALGGALPEEQRTQHRLVIVDTPLALPGGETFLMELYARAPLTGGARAVYRAVYAEGELALGAASQVLRWTHAGGKLSVGDHAVLRGRVSSDTAVSLGSGVGFERIGAPVIAVGQAHEPPPRPLDGLPVYHLPPQARRIGEHLRIEGDLEIPAEVRVRGDLVVAGRLRIGLGTIVEGSITAHRAIELAQEVQISGSAVSRTELIVGQAAWIRGPAIAEAKIQLGRDAVVGGPNEPATVAAPEIELARGATVYGQISAMKGARTL